MAVKAIIFDIDGVLADSREAVVHNTETLLREYGFAFEHENVLKMSRAHSADTVLLSLVPALSEEPEKLRAMLKRLSLLTVGNMHLIGPLPLAEKIPALAARYKLAAASNRKASAKIVLERLGILRHFSAVLTSADAAAKPAPDMLLIALQKLRVDSSEAVFIGDNEEDLEAGKAAGVRSIMLDGSKEGECKKFLLEFL